MGSALKIDIRYHTQNYEFRDSQSSSSMLHNLSKVSLLPSRNEGQRLSTMPLSHNAMIPCVHNAMRQHRIEAELGVIDSTQRITA